MSQLHQGSHSEPEAARLQRVERLLHGSTSWEPTTPPPADLCARVADRIAGRSARPVKHRARFSFVSYGLIASGACAAIALAVVWPGRVAPVAPSVATDTIAPMAGAADSTPAWSPSPVSQKVGAGRNSGTLASYVQEQGGQEPAADVQLTQVAEGTQHKVERNRPSRQRSYLPRRRNQTVYASQQSPVKPTILTTQQSKPQTLAEGPYPEETGGDMVALVPVVLTEYEPDPNGDGSSESLQATYTPAVVAVSIKQDALGETKLQALPLTEAPTSETMPTPSATPASEATPQPAPTSQPK